MPLLYGFWKTRDLLCAPPAAGEYQHLESRAGESWLSRAPTITPVANIVEPVVSLNYNLFHTGARRIGPPGPLL